MTTLSIQTAQNTLLQMREASLGERIIATFIDIGVMLVYAGVISIAVKISGLSWTKFLFVPLMFYSIVFELLWGRSLGKKILNLDIVHDSGAPLSFVHILLRWILRIVDVWMFMGSIATVSIILSKNGQRLGDLAAGTLVVKPKKLSTSLEKNYYNAEESYVAVFEEVKLLNDEDVQVAKDALEFLKDRGYGKAAGKILNRTRSFLEKKMKVESELKNVPFLKTVLKDYYILLTED